MSSEYSTPELLRILRLSEAELRSCLRSALLPLSRRGAACTYSFQQLVLLRTTHGLRSDGVSVRQIRKVPVSLQRQLEDGQTLSSSKIYASGQRVVVWDGTSHWQPDSGQCLLNFDTTHPMITTQPLKRPGGAEGSPTDSPLSWFGRALRLQDESVEEAGRAYQEAIRLRPAFVEAHINLGLLNHNRGELKGAEACYLRALQYAPDWALAHFNLGVVLEDQEEKHGAMDAYEAALRQNPDFRDAHCNLAQLYERPERRRDAVRHYAAAKRLLQTSR